MDGSKSLNTTEQHYTTTACIKDESYFINSSQCSNFDCTRWVHYGCTNMPTYLLQILLTNQQKRRNGIA